MPVLLRLFHKTRHKLGLVVHLRDRRVIQAEAREFSIAHISSKSLPLFLAFAAVQIAMPVIHTISALPLGRQVVVIQEINREAVLRAKPAPT